MTIDIIIPTIRTREEIAPLVAEIERTAGCDVRVIATCQQVSAAKNRNIGLDLSTSDPVIMVDDDMEQFPQGWAVRLCEVLAERPNCVMASPQLASPKGGAGCMMGGHAIRRDGITSAQQRKLPTACVAIRRNPIRFDEAYIACGWEDDDYCAQLRLANPDAEFLVRHDLWIVHRNEAKGQFGENWKINEAYFMNKWIDRKGSRLR